MRSSMATMHNDLILTNDGISGNMNTFHKVVSAMAVNAAELAINAARVISNVEFTPVQIPAAPVFPSPFFSVSETPSSGPGQPPPPPPPPMQPQLRQPLLLDQQQVPL
ncbi:hypothetical protein K457DRAFT_579208 [Linnemannia elongata AG-77]|uniref:Uncharacterized protein n=1 Tax=Linnemannia elongata AG-77 TaxID=1314771 RepID=A0A197KE90_9FUNG|nr:hypothetical protein K457DRAFT_579208 [Linnemannia elongata AG-77]